MLVEAVTLASTRAEIQERDSADERQILSDVIILLFKCHFDHF